MSQSETHTELLNTQLNAETKDKQDSSIESVELVTNERWHETELWIRGKEGEYFITLGDYIILKGLSTKEEAYVRLENRDYNLIMNMIAMMIEVNNIIRIDIMEKILDSKIETLTNKLK